MENRPHPWRGWGTGLDRANGEILRLFGRVPASVRSPEEGVACQGQQSCNPEAWHRLPWARAQGGDRHWWDARLHRNHREPLSPDNSPAGGPSFVLALCTRAAHGMLVNFVRACVGQWAIAKFLAGRRGLEGAQNFYAKVWGCRRVVGECRAGKGRGRRTELHTIFGLIVCQLVVATVVESFSNYGRNCGRFSNCSR